MDTMTLVHEIDGRAFTLAACPRPRRLFVLQGRAWITESVRRPPAAPVPDLWLGAGETLVLPAGSRWVVQADGDLRLALRVQPPARPRPAVGWALAAARALSRAGFSLGAAGRRLAARSSALPASSAR